MEPSQEEESTTPVFSFYLSELAQYEVSSVNYSPARAQLCKALCDAFQLQTESKAEILATRTDLGQYHADNYLGLLQIAAELWALEFTDEKSRRKRTKTEESLVKERLAMFNLDLPSGSKNVVFAGMFAYHRLCVTGSLAAAERLKQQRSKVAINWFGGHGRARKARAVGGCFVNDSVLACLSLSSRFDRILHISMDFAHCDGVEEAFYTSDRIATLSFHSASFSTGVEEDTGYGAGTGYAVNVPIKPSCFTDETFVPLFSNILTRAKEAFAPSAIVFIASPSVLAGNRDTELDLSLKGYLECVETVHKLGLPLLILGGAGSSASIAALAWCAATAKVLGQDLRGQAIPNTCSALDHFNLQKQKVEVEARPSKCSPADKEEMKALENRITERLAQLIKVKKEPELTV